MTEAEILDRVDRLRTFRDAPRFKTGGQQWDWLLDGLAELSLDLSTLPYLEANDRRPRHPGQGTPRTPDKEQVT